MTMNRFVLRILILLGLLTGWTGIAAAGHMTATLDAETPHPRPGSRITLALAMKPEKTWHGYWENPGDAGIATTVKWTLPAGVTVGRLRYPVPRRLIVQGLMNYVYEQPYAYLMTLTIPANIRPGTPIVISGAANWLACSPAICVPERGTVSIALTAGDGAIASADRARFDAWRARLPLPLAQPARFERKGDRIRIAIPFPGGRPLAAPYFYPATDGVIDYAAPQSISRNGDGVIVEVKASPAGARPATLSGVLAIGHDRGLSLTATPGAVPAASSPVAANARHARSIRSNGRPSAA